jgi:hypothetical protein
MGEAGGSGDTGKKKRGEIAVGRDLVSNRARETSNMELRIPLSRREGRIRQADEEIAAAAGTPACGVGGRGISWRSGGGASSRRLGR